MSECLSVHLKARPEGWVKPSDFDIRRGPVPAAGPGEVVVRNHFLSLDPYMRGRMDARKSYAAPLEIGDLMIGATVGEIIQSENPRFNVGDRVTGMLGWTTHAVSNGTGLMKIKDTDLPLSAYLGVLGMPGATAWVGLIDICKPKAGETVVVDAATGAVGGVVGQLAKAHGARAVGIAGGPDKCRHAVERLGFDACLDYRAVDFTQALKAATPNGIDCIFENVGGEIFDALLARTNAFGRVAVCGLISQYNSAPYAMKNIGLVLINRLKMQGFIVSESMELWPQAHTEIANLIRQDKLKFHETVAEGIAAAPEAFIGLLKGQNLGKQLVKLI